MRDTFRETPEKGNGRERVQVEIPAVALAQRKQIIAAANPNRTALYATLTARFNNPNAVFATRHFNNPDEFHTGNLLQNPTTITQSAGLPNQIHYIVDMDDQVYDVVSDVMEEFIEILALDYIINNS